MSRGAASIQCITGLQREMQCILLAAKSKASHYAASPELVHCTIPANSEMHAIMRCVIPAIAEQRAAMRGILRGP
eukprot:60874-Alexandrium_andersonii.AAC.1